MYKLYRRNGSKVWHYRIFRTGIRRTTGIEIRDLADQYAKKKAEEYFRRKKLGEKPRKTWKESAARRLRSKLGMPSFEQDKISLRWLDNLTFIVNEEEKRLRDLYLDEITDEMIDVIKGKGTGSNATTNKRLMVIKGIFKAEKVPGPTIRMLPEPKKRIRWLTHDEAERLLNVLPEHQADMARFTLATGHRMSNVTRLEWSQVDLERRVMWIHADQYKTRKDKGFPLNAEAILVLRKQVGRHPKFVFTFRGCPVKKVNGKAWRKARKRAGIDNFHWHDLRHTWASWHIQNNTPSAVLKELGGWEDPRMPDRYAHLGEGHLAEYADNLSRLKLVEKSAQTGHSQLMQEGGK